MIMEFGDEKSLLIILPAKKMIRKRLQRTRDCHIVDKMEKVYQLLPREV